MEKLKKEFLAQIRLEVLFGFDNPEDILEKVIERYLDEDGLEEEWMYQKIVEYFEKHQADSKNWSHPTDFEKLCRVFDTLNEKGIIALHKPGYTDEEGEDEANEAKAILDDEGFPVLGYCFYQAQDLEGAIRPDFGKLCIYFSCFEDDDNNPIDVANQIISSLQEENFEVEWNGLPERRIAILNMNWQKAYNEERWGALRVVHNICGEFY